MKILRFETVIRAVTTGGAAAGICLGLLWATGTLAQGVTARPGSRTGFVAYTITELSPPPGCTDTIGRKVNNQGHVIGEATTMNVSSHAVLWRDGKAVDLGVLGGATSHGFGLNDFDTAVGISDAEATPGIVSIHAFQWQRGAITDIQTAPPEQGTWKAMDINSRGLVVGVAFIQFKGQHAIQWNRGEFTDMGTLGGNNSQARAINDKGQSVGQSDLMQGIGPKHAFLYDPGRGMQDLGALNTGLESDAQGINNLGDVVGWSLASDPAVTHESHSHAFLWHNGRMQELSGLGGDESSASGINDRGQIVGVASTANNRQYEAVLWQGERVVRLQDLLPPDTDWRLEPSREGPYNLGHLSINNKGQIAGTARHNGKIRGFLMTPVAAQ